MHGLRLLDEHGYRTLAGIAAYIWSPHGTSPATGDGPTARHHQALAAALGGRGATLLFMEAFFLGAGSATAICHVTLVQRVRVLY